MKHLKEKLEKFITKNTVLCLIILFIIGIIIYGTVAKLMTNPLYIVNDEELYVNMARSFFYEHNFSRSYELGNYSCVIYSIIISFAYNFYSAENLLFIMRLIGVIAMVSCIFPTYLLSNKILGSKIKAVAISAASLVMPEMVSGSYLIQENLSYPMFLWIAYLVYLRFTSKKEKNLKIDIAILFMFALIFFTKSYTIVFAAAYFFTLFIDTIKKKEYKNIKNIFIQGIIFCILVLMRLNTNKISKWICKWKQPL